MNSVPVVGASTFEVAIKVRAHIVPRGDDNWSLNPTPASWQHRQMAWGLQFFRNCHLRLEVNIYEFSPRILLASWKSFGKSVTRFACRQHKLASSKSPTR